MIAAHFDVSVQSGRRDLETVSRVLAVYEERTGGGPTVYRLLARKAVEADGQVREGEGQSGRKGRGQATLCSH
jgi:hypothetical protein